MQDDNQSERTETGVSEQPTGVEASEQMQAPEVEASVPGEPEALIARPAEKPRGFKQKLTAVKTYYLSRKKLTIPVTILVVIGLLLAVPATRYAVLGSFIKKDFTATVLDSKTNQPISSAELQLAGQSARTDQSGKVTFHGVKAGPHALVVAKKYYTDTSTNVLVPITGSGVSAEVRLTATGRQVKVSVVNKISGKGVKNASLSAAGTEVKTNENGEATIVLPPDVETQDATITTDGYNNQTVKVAVIEDEKVAEQNKFTITPSGKVYFLSKRTGKINVMKSDLDGANATVVVEATGNEDDGDTILLASQDWKYLALKAKRDGADKPASLYLIDTSNDKLTTMDEGDASFTLTGWSGHTFVYLVQRDKVQFWQPNKYSIKSFNADGAKLNTLDSTAGEGSGAGSYYGTDYKSEYYTNLILVGDTVHYDKTWGSGIYSADGSGLAGKQNGIYSVKANGQDKKTLKSFDATKYSSMESKLYKPTEVYYRLYTKSGGSEFYEVENGAVQTKGDLSNQFYGFYPTYLYDPSNKQTFWAEPRDGKNTLFIGDNEGDNSKTIAELSEYAAYGWYTDDYILLSKNSSELYIAPATEFGQNVLKITDYHKPNTTFYGYGGGYGGL